MKVIQLIKLIDLIRLLGLLGLAGEAYQPNGIDQGLVMLIHPNCMNLITFKLRGASMLIKPSQVAMLTASNQAHEYNETNMASSLVKAHHY